MSPAGPPVPTPTPVITYNPKADAERYTLLLWNHIGMRIVNLMKNHHVQHEPGGTDRILLPLSGLKDVQFSIAPTNNDVLKYNAAWKRWEAGTAIASGIHQVHFTLVLPALVIPPGPCNITGSNMTIRAVMFRTDDSTISGSLNVSGHSYGIGTNYSGLTDIWAPNASMSLTLDNYGSDGTYLAIDVAAG